MFFKMEEMVSAAMDIPVHTRNLYSKREADGQNRKCNRSNHLRDLLDKASAGLLVICERNH